MALPMDKDKLPDVTATMACLNLESQMVTVFIIMTIVLIMPVISWKGKKKEKVKCILYTRVNQTAP